ncbi:tetratricopeptide repeat protein [Roseibium sp. RKSG952]|uniref:tetratricopeptide repeat protein n=1 Tax=Roseibium sp. RKSG952 TaxID=2529384 RepID=UPI0012BC192E|nr:tetratricopeptide repeat protein [Roseibium sp. RKSG952]MTH97649.1 tetratricopeptide repeat protein [Roseibium sp. RKSG952]
MALGAVPSLAQTAGEDGTPSANLSAEALEARQLALLNAMLLNPADLDVAFDYATIAAQNGDFEAAIGTYERMLIFAPGLPRIQLELGVLYYRLGAFDVARSYFEAALSAPNVPPEVEARVATYLAAIDQQDRTTEFSATVVAGARYQTNANAAPGSRRVDLNGGTFILDETATGRADYNGFIAANIHAAYDLGAQGDLLEADLIVYAARYADLVRLDTGLAELTFGPSFNLKRIGLDNGRLGVYGILSGIRLDHANYNGTVGVGSRLAYAFGPFTFFDGKLEYRQRWYNDTAAYPTVSDRNGYQLETLLTLTRQVSGSFTARTLLLGDFEETVRQFTQSWELGIGVGGTYQFPSPIKRIADDWSIDLEAGYIYREYQGPDPLIDPTQSQRDNEGWIRGVLAVPVRSDVLIGLTGEFRRQQSNYDVSTYNNTSAMLSVAKSF